ncbi:MAG: Na+ dependent nucleoside transporter [Bacteroidia bacterium]|nr:Na+ dependent nucleoside transporter [Bacteroidia bacterium]MBT8275976.1 Na+ dependent nucleoside transporter [Bacteroidia bacterium]NNF29824.1 Na+ dependent nucleoside transporter [Flavobacteriaceae bacterium]NNK53816.1 Na+ dependent nucleoside transporter [Flavobacteriaceae bacterium]NNM08560.1 Na+ dependent nucleoside transporter [Flavobacteriaceae bacterium]
MHKILLLFLFVFSFGNQYGQELEQSWKFSAIENDAGESIVPVNSEVDFLKFNNGAFTYELAAKDSLKASGDYVLQNNLLVFFYSKPSDTIRRYRISEHTDSTLVFSENEVFYKFTSEPADNASAVVPVKKKRIAIDPNQGLGVTAYSVFRGAIGMIFLLFVCYFLSSNRRKINWRLVFSGLALQLIFAVLVLKVPFVATIFEWFSEKVVAFLALADVGANFVLGAWPDLAEIFEVKFDENGNIMKESFTIGYMFAFKVLPTIVFFSAFTSLLYYLGILQKIVYAFAWIMSKTMRLSGAESLAAAANIFIGQTEAPLVVKPYLEKMTKSEMLCLMVGGMATIAGGVLAAFIAFLGGDSDAERVIFAKHLLTASIMSAPAAIIIAKMLYPEVESVNTKLNIAREKIGSNVLDAISKGTTDGIKLAVNVGAMLLVFTSLMAVLNWISADLFGASTGLNDKITAATDGRYTELSMQYILGNVFAPIAWIIGVPAEDITVVGQLLGEKTILNEFFAYASLSDLKNAGAITNYRSIVIATYALCGFANFASIGIQIGGIGVLAPSQRKVLAAFGVKALIGGTVAALLTATIAGMLIG